MLIITSVTVLQRQANWAPWICATEDQANAYKIWEFVDPDKENKEEPKAPETKPKLNLNTGIIQINIKIAKSKY